MKSCVKILIIATSVAIFASACCKETPQIKATVSAEPSDVGLHSVTISGNLFVEPEGEFSKSATLYYSSTVSTKEDLLSSGTQISLSLGSEGYFSSVLSSLISDTPYYFMIKAKVDEIETQTAVSAFKTLTPPAGTVDLGLSVLWADSNLGADNPEKYGKFYQWAGTEDVSLKVLFWNVCPFHSGLFETKNWTKYNTIASYGTADNKVVLDLEDDAAHVALAGDWRMPTESEWKELIDNCTWTWSVQNTHFGYKISSNISGYVDKSIFLPAAGYRSNESFDYVGSMGSYWSSSLDTEKPSQGHAVTFNSGSYKVSSIYRYFGQTIRPVMSCK